MSRCSTLFSHALAVLLLVATVSCQRGVTPVKQPSIDPLSAGKLAMEMYDTNGDGVVSGVELEKAPSLKAALPRLDTNGDKGVSADEVAERVKAWKAMKTGMASVRAHVTLDGQPLAGAKVVFEPESFLGDQVKKATSTTNQFGDVAPVVAKEDRDNPTLPGGVHLGLYKVRFSKQTNGKETIPAKFNVETIVGQEVSNDEPGIVNNNLAYALKSGG
jgi:hypothetical protein